MSHEETIRAAFEKSGFPDVSIAARDLPDADVKVWLIHSRKESDRRLIDGESKLAGVAFSVSGLELITATDLTELIRVRANLFAQHLHRAIESVPSE